MFLRDVGDGVSERLKFSDRGETRPPVKIEAPTDRESGADLMGEILSCVGPDFHLQNASPGTSRHQKPISPISSAG